MYSILCKKLKLRCLNNNLKLNLMTKFSFILIFACCFSYISFAQKTDTLVTASGIKYLFTQKGTGTALKPGWLAICHYKLKLTNDTVIDDSRKRNVPLVEKYPSKRFIPGFNEALSLMHVGDRGVFFIPSSLGYGPKGKGPVPPAATLVFDIELIDSREKTLGMVLDSVLFEKPVTENSKPRTAEMLKTFDEMKKKKFKDVYVAEAELNAMGYSLIKKYPKDAVEIFKLNVKLFPKSFNVYDSLGEGYMTIGENKLAIKNYEKSLKLNPQNTAAVDMIKKMKESEAKPKSDE